MPAYVIANVDVHDPERYREYAAGVPDSIASFGGRYVVRGGDAEAREGEWQPKRLVIIEFDSLDQARRWYESEEYRPLRDLRQATSSAELVIVEGVAG